MDAIILRVVRMSDAEDKHNESILEEARQGLRNLAARPAAPSLAARIRQLLPDIEHARACGVSRSEIVEELRRHGLAVSEKYFATALARARRKRMHAPGKGTTDLSPAPGTAKDPDHNPVRKDPASICPNLHRRSNGTRWKDRRSLSARKTKRRNEYGNTLFDDSRQRGNWKEFCVPPPCAISAREQRGCFDYRYGFCKPDAQPI